MGHKGKSATHITDLGVVVMHPELLLLRHNDVDHHQGVGGAALAVTWQVTAGCNNLNLSLLLAHHTLTNPPPPCLP